MRRARRRADEEELFRFGRLQVLVFRLHWGLGAVVDAGAVAVDGGAIESEADDRGVVGGREGADDAAEGAEGGPGGERGVCGDGGAEGEEGRGVEGVWVCEVL